MTDGSDDTLVESEAATQPAHRPGTAPTGQQEVGRYALLEVLGRGGMGEVVRAIDPKLDREVAFKRMTARDPDDTEIRRFLREATIQARLDHPAVVPVHDAGVDADGRPYFTMKRLAGVTLASVLDAGSTREKLLRTFVEVCLAIDLAHARNVIHRDLKPANIMLGNYGEVYVLDWGLARVIGEADSQGGARDAAGSGVTVAGALLGTPGYMAPEQVRDASTVDRPADIYALGAILFEILAGEPLHPRGHEAALATTLEGVDGSPGRRAPDRAIPPELDALCGAMVASEPAARPTARDVADRVQAYLDGDRDLARRSALAREHLATARAALADGRRADAMRAAGRALALDPELAGAAELVTALMLEPPQPPPPELERAWHDAETANVMRHAKSAKYLYLVFPLFLPVVLWGGVKSPPAVAGLLTMVFVLLVTTVIIARRGEGTLREMVMYMVATAGLIALVGRLCGPLILTPAVACVVVMSGMMYPTLARRPYVLLITTIVGWLLPTALEAAGLLGPTWSIDPGVILSTSNMLEIGGAPTFVLVFGGTLMSIATATFHMWNLSRAGLDAQRQQVSQAWHLRQLLP